uniref:Ser/Thr-rich protein T10 in DGCR region n=1 Tax=Anthurium amnicola TaxID=1678845 RepID=A0A1D1XD83_9ARAE
MCIAAWVWQDHPLYQFLLVHNRDEYHDRPTKPVGWWGEGSQNILGGRDGLAGGTWLGCTRNGRLAFLTNVLEPDVIPTTKSRGDLPVKFLECGKSPLEFAEEAANEADQYNGFNLMLVDLCSKTMVYVSNRPKAKPVSIELVAPGLHVLTNASLDTPWHKALRLGKHFKELLYKYDEEEIPAKEMVEKLMRDTVKADRDCLPNTGCSSDWELSLSSIFVEVDTKLGRYGTRSTAVLAVKTNGKVDFYETYLEMGAWKEHTVQYRLEDTQMT